MELDIRSADWPAFETIMGENGAYGGCWCMYWRVPKKQLDVQMGEGNRCAMKQVFDDGLAPGLVAWLEDVPIGWLQVDRREAFVRLQSSRVLRPVDDRPAWCVSCFVIDKAHRRKGVATDLLRAACDFVRQRGGDILEGYPIDPPKRPYPAVYAWTGFAGSFRDAGFTEVARRSPTRPIMRRHL